jgi:pimeloyl-ACP methyl ester carboxylesterase
VSEGRVMQGPNEFVITGTLTGSRWVIFEQSSHMQFAEEPDLYLETVAGFLAEVETA